MTSEVSSLLDSGAGKAQKTQGESLSTFLASLTSSGIILGIGIIVHIFLRAKFPEYYSQQTHRTAESKWKPLLLSRWCFLSSIPAPRFDHMSSIDNYFFDRYLHTVARIFLLLGAVVPPVLIPLNMIDGKNEAQGVRGLDRLSFSNVGLSHTTRYWGHLLMAVFVVISVCQILALELKEYTRVKHQLNESEFSLSKASLFLVSKSKQQLSTDSVRRKFRNIAGGVYTIRINRDYSQLHSKLRDRNELVEKLEIAETNFIIKTNTKTTSLGLNSNGKSHKDRPLTRLPLLSWLPPLPMVGQKVDAIHHLCTEIARCNREIENDQQNPIKFPQTNSVFLRLRQRISTDLKLLAIRTRIPQSWTIKHEVAPEDTIWQNITLSWWEQCIRTTMVYLLVTLLTFGFALPVTVIGSLSQIKYLDNTVSWLQWIRVIPTWLIGTIQGVLPPLLMAVVTTIIPTAIRLFANIQGLHSRQAIENHVQIYYFIFLFVQEFLTISLSAGITTIIGELSDNIQAVPAILAQNLPKSCNYFFAYIIMRTFTTIVSVLTQVSGLVNIFVLSPLLDKTPRQKWMRSQSAGTQRWGTFIPIFTNIACIGLVYSVIAPLILIIGIIYFGALGFLYQLYPPKLTDLDLGGNGNFYPTAILQLFTGIYFMELCLVGLFFLVRDADNTATCTTQAVVMIIITVLTALFHYTLDHEIQWSLFLGRVKNKIDQVSEQPMWRCRRKANKLSPREPITLQANPAQDDALTSPCPVIWIPKDNRGIADSEVYHIKRSYDNIWISNEGASLNERGKLELKGDPPENSQ